MLDDVAGLEWLAGDGAFAPKWKKSASAIPHCSGSGRGPREGSEQADTTYQPFAFPELLARVRKLLRKNGLEPRLHRQLS